MKGDVTISTVFEGLLIVGFAIYLFYLLVYSKLMVITLLEEENRERNAINLVNGLISHEKLAYEKDGVIFRGILDSKKLDKIFYKSKEGLKSEREFREVIFNPDFKEGKLSIKDLGLGYSQLITIIHIVDLDDCNEIQCIVWSGIILPVLTLKDFERSEPEYRFFKCLYDSFDGNLLRPTITCPGFAITGGIVGSFVGGPVGSIVGAGVGCLIGFLSNLFSWAELKNCAILAKMRVENFYVTDFITQKQGLPINIVNESGDVHIGRIIIGIIELKPPSEAPRR